MAARVEVVNGVVGVGVGGDGGSGGIDAPRPSCNDFAKTKKRCAKRLIREIRGMETHARQRKHILRYLKKIRINKMNSTTSQVEDLPEILDQFAARKVLIGLFPLPPIDLGLTLTTNFDIQMWLMTSPFLFTAALDLARFLDTIMAASKVLQDLKEPKAIHLDTRENLLFKVVADETIFVDSEEQLVERRDAATNRNEITSVMLYRPHSLFGLTLDVSAACDVARAFDIMIAALYSCLQYQTPSDQTIPLVHFGYFGDLKQLLVTLPGCAKPSVPPPFTWTTAGLLNKASLQSSVKLLVLKQRDCSTKGKEVVLYRPRFFNGLTLDLTVACDVCPVVQTISAAPIYMDYHRITELSIPIGDQTQIVADETVIVDSEEQSCLNTTAVSECFSLRRRFCGTATPVSTRPRELVKWVGPSDVTDNGLDLDEVESWEVSDMFATNEANFGYKSTFDETMSEYTTLLVVEDTTDYVLRGKEPVV
ncbi:putative ataxin-2-like protein-like isoform X3 [Apostichopus japonicus]|uniref:Putative ataxin-2-like protein-like isoform X3 n=1 Tax=Stichopus japonicus TaxID=307972 RepID=A0A2G8LN87_STIJA|nr:putative ataxin-2-like protein-like isoform X3 [Apostichopus japonicus]